MRDTPNRGYQLGSLVALLAMLAAVVFLGKECGRDAGTAFDRLTRPPASSPPSKPPSPQD